MKKNIKKIEEILNEFYPIPDNAIMPDIQAEMFLEILFAFKVFEKYGINLEDYKNISVSHINTILLTENDLMPFEEHKIKNLMCDWPLDIGCFTLDNIICDDKSESIKILGEFIKVNLKENDILLNFKKIELKNYQRILKGELSNNGSKIDSIKYQRILKSKFGSINLCLTRKPDYEISVNDMIKIENIFKGINELSGYEIYSIYMGMKNKHNVNFVMGEEIVDFSDVSSEDDLLLINSKKYLLGNLENKSFKGTITVDDEISYYIGYAKGFNMIYSNIDPQYERYDKKYDYVLATLPFKKRNELYVDKWVEIMKSPISDEVSGEVINNSDYIRYVSNLYYYCKKGGIFSLIHNIKSLTKLTDTPILKKKGFMFDLKVRLEKIKVFKKDPLEKKSRQVIVIIRKNPDNVSDNISINIDSDIIEVPAEEFKIEDVFKMVFPVYIEGLVKLNDISETIYRGNTRIDPQVKGDKDIILLTPQSLSSSTSDVYIGLSDKNGKNNVKSEHYLENGDILIVSRGRMPKVYLFENQYFHKGKKYKSVVDGNISVIRLKDKKYSKQIYTLLKTREFQKSIKEEMSKKNLLRIGFIREFSLPNIKFENFEELMDMYEYFNKISVHEAKELKKSENEKNIILESITKILEGDK